MRSCNIHTHTSYSGSASLVRRRQARQCSRGIRHVLSVLPRKEESATSSVEQVISARKAKEQRYLVEGFPIAGVTFEGRQELIKALQPDQVVLLERETWNPYDPNAVRVMDLLERTLGYIPRRDGMNARFTYEIGFAIVASAGPVKDSKLFGARIYARPQVPSLLLDSVPTAAAARFIDLPATFGDRWPALHATTLAAANFHCELTGISQGQLPVQLLPHWRYNEAAKAVQLTRLVVVCEPLAEAKARLEAGVEALAGHESAEQAAAGLTELQAGPDGQLFAEVNGFDDRDAVQYYELVRRRCRLLKEQQWRVEELL